MGVSCALQYIDTLSDFFNARFTRIAQLSNIKVVQRNNDYIARQ